MQGVGEVDKKSQNLGNAVCKHSLWTNPNMYPKFFLQNFLRFYKRKFLHSMLCNFRVCVRKFSLLFFQSVLWWFHSVAVARVAAPRHRRHLSRRRRRCILHSIEVSRRLLGWHSEQNFIRFFLSNNFSLSNFAYHGHFPARFGSNSRIFPQNLSYY